MKLKSLVTLLMIALASSSQAFASSFNDCYSEAKSAFTYRSDAIKACAGARSTFSECYAEAKSAFTYREEAIKACAPPNACE